MAASGKSNPLSVDSFKDKASKKADDGNLHTRDGSVDRFGKQAVRGRTGGWKSAILILVNQGLATLAFFGVGVNLVLFLTRVMRQSNAEAANNVSKWTGTVYLFSLVGAFVSDSYWGRYKTCAIFQLIFVMGLILLSLSTHLFLIKPKGCGDEGILCQTHSTAEMAVFYLSIYLVALGNGGYQPSIATFGSDQFDEEDPQEGISKIAFFSYFYLALNLGSLFSNTILGYFEDAGIWELGFGISAASAFLALVIFLCGTYRYRHFEPQGNPLFRFSQVIAAAGRKWRIETPQHGHNHLYEADKEESAFRKILHSEDFKFLDKAAVITVEVTEGDQTEVLNPWRLCSVTQVEEVKCILRLLPIWLCTIVYSMVFTQMASLFVEQGAAMKTTVYRFHIPPASMSSFDTLSVAVFIFLYRRIISPCYSRLMGKSMTELQRMGVGLAIAAMAMVSSGLVEIQRLKRVGDLIHSPSSLSILWQIPQYVLVGASEVFMYIGQLEFFNGQSPDGLKSFGSALCMTSIAFGNYFSTLTVNVVMKITTRNESPGWIPGNLNLGHLDRFYFLLAALTVIDLFVYVALAKRYKGISREERVAPRGEEEEGRILVF